MGIPLPQQLMWQKYRGGGIVTKSSEAWEFHGPLIWRIFNAFSPLKGRFFLNFRHNAQNTLVFPDYSIFRPGNMCPKEATPDLWKGVSIQKRSFSAPVAVWPNPKFRQSTLQFKLLRVPLRNRANKEIFLASFLVFLCIFGGPLLAAFYWWPRHGRRRLIKRF